METNVAAFAGFSAQDRWINPGLYSEKPRSKDRLFIKHGIQVNTTGDVLLTGRLPENTVVFNYVMNLEAVYCAASTTVGDLLEGFREIESLPGWDDTPIQLSALDSPALRNVVAHYSLIPRDVEQKAGRFREALLSLESEHSVPFLRELLRAIVSGEFELPGGGLADTPALRVVQRLLQVSPTDAIRELRPLLRTTQNHRVRVGYFQLSLAGAMLGHLASADDATSWGEWVWDDVEWFRQGMLSAVADQALATSLQAALIAIGIVVEDTGQDSDIPGIARRLDTEIGRSLSLLKGERNRQFFLQFIADSLSQVITNKNLSRHFTKLLVFFKYVLHDGAVLWPRRGLLGMLHKFFPNPAARPVVS
jgi:hypothetical protein